MTARARRRGTTVALLPAARLEAMLAAAVQGGILLLLLTPLVLTPSTYFPFVVGKAVYARSVIEIVVGLWAVLALLAPAYRPRRSVVLILLGAGVAAAVASAFMGASPQRSIWSSYERMQGVVESAHWAALALVAACTLHTARQWSVLFNCSVAVGAVVAVIAICQKLGVSGMPFYGIYLRIDVHRPASTLGNTIYLSAYLLINAVLACGLLARSFAPDPAPADARRDGRRAGRAARRAAARRRTPTPTPEEVSRRRRAVLWRTFWLASLAVHLWAVGEADALGPILGAAAGVGALALACTALARQRRTWWIGMSLVCALALVAALPVVLRATGTTSIVESVPSQLLRRFVRMEESRTVRTRLAAWQAGFEGFADKPVFGWGPENFLVVFGRHGDEFPKRMQPHDAAHSAFVEELATKGALGAGIYLALWAAAVVLLLRAARRAKGRERILLLTVGTALMTYLASTQSLFATTVGSMQVALLFAFVAGLEMRARPVPGNPWQVPRGVPVPAAVVVVGCLVGAGLYTNQAIHAAGGAFLKASMASRSVSQARERYDAAIDEFRPVASDVYLHLFRNFAKRLRRKSALAGSALPWLDLRAAEAVAAEPDNWLLHLALARLYLAAAEKYPERLQDGRRHAEKVLQLVPKRRGALSIMGTPPPPRGLRYSALANAIELQWHLAPGALTYVVDEGLVDARTGPRRWQRVYEGVGSRARMPVRGVGTRIYRVKACLGLGNCARGSERVAVQVEAAGPAPRPDATNAAPLDGVDGVDESRGA